MFKGGEFLFVVMGWNEEEELLYFIIGVFEIMVLEKEERWVLFNKSMLEWFIFVKLIMKYIMYYLFE